MTKVRLFSGSEAVTPVVRLNECCLPTQVYNTGTLFTKQKPPKGVLAVLR